MIPALVGRINYSGELGYELWVAPEYQRALFDQLMAAGEEYGIRLFGFRALMSLRLEKSYGTWYREYRPIYTLHEAGLQRYVKLDHEFIGRAAYEKEAETGPERRLVAFVVEPDPDEPADVIGDEPIWHDGAVVGWVTSGGYGHHVERLDRAGVRADGARDAGRPGRRRLRDRDHRAAAAGPAPAASRCSTRRVSGCASDRGRRRPPRARRRRRRPGGSSSTGGPSRSSRAIRWRWRSCGAARCRGAAGRCAWRGTAGTASPRSTASPTCGPARPRRARACASRGTRPTAMPALPVVAATDLTATPLPAAIERPATSRSTSRSSAAGRAGGPRPRTRSAAGQVGPCPRCRGRRRGRGDLRRADDRRPDAGRDAPRPPARDRRRDRGRRDPSGLPGQPAGRARDRPGRRAAARRRRRPGRVVAVGTPPDGRAVRRHSPGALRRGSKATTARAASAPS